MTISLPPHKTKIVCTIGPSSCSDRVIGRLIRAGMNVARLNLSHGTIPEHLRTLNRIRAAARKLKRTVGIMIDLPGPKIRVGTMKDAPRLLKKHDLVTLVEAPESDDPRIIPVDYRGLAGYVSRNDSIYLNDGFIQLKVLKRLGGRLFCRVLIGGTLLSHKGLNIPGALAGISAVTGHDLRIIDEFSGRADLFGISFVQDRDDVLRVRNRARKKGRTPLIIAKIERSSAVRNIDSILEAADGIMVARGDLGVEIPIERVPVVQKLLIRKANDRNRVVITATQMLLSMTDHVRPTRAEVTDVANAILDGTDAVMLSEETAMGGYPVEAAVMMGRIAAITEGKRKEVGCSCGAAAFSGTPGSGQIEDRLAFDVQRTIETMQVHTVITHTASRLMPHRISRFKPGCWIIAAITDRSALHLLNLSYGVYPCMLRDPRGWREEIMDALRKNRLIRRGDRLLELEESVNGKGGPASALNILTV